jgi:hypothetical protein
VKSPALNLAINNSRVFKGTIWKTLVDESDKRIFVETRNADEKRVCFSAYSFNDNLWLWSDIAFEEPWWISLGYVQDEILLLTVYNDTNNPDNKSLVAVDAGTGKILWWRNNFVVAYVTTNGVMGSDTKFGSSLVALALKTGEILPAMLIQSPSVQNFNVIRPLQYLDGSDHFLTVRAFVERKCNVTPVSVIEYCEHSSWIMVSVFIQEKELANYLIVFDSDGQIVLKEQLGENLKGIAYDTFFLFEGFIIFVKNKRELVSYKIA